MKQFYSILIFTFFIVVGGISQKTYDFESPATSVTLQYFGSSLDGTLSKVINNPDASGINTSAKVGQFIKTPGAELWTGAFAKPAISPVDATTGGTICLKVWMDHVGGVSVKLEAPVEGGENWITTQPYTTPNTWAELCFDLSDPSIEDSKIPAAGRTFGGFVLFFDFLQPAVTADESYYFDDLVIPVGETTSSTTIILDYESGGTSGDFEYFGNSDLNGQFTTVVNNPNASGINTSSKVAKYIKNAKALDWAGAYNIPGRAIEFVPGNQVCIKVHMDHIGKIALKFEGSTSMKPNWIDTISNTKINEWEEICFDPTIPSIEAPKEPAASTFATVVVFFDFGKVGTGVDVTSYFDDIIVKSGNVQVDKVINFRVNMNSYTASFDKVAVSGTFNNWSGDSNPLKDDDGDGIWEGSISLPNGSYEYKVTLDNKAKEETFLGTEECTKSLDAFTNRVLIVSGDRSVPEFCYNSCYACGEEIKINFKLGMGSVTPNPDGVWLSGGGNFDVPGGKYKMNDDDKDGIYEIVVPRMKGFSSYFAFANGPCGDFSCKEILEGLPCGDPTNFNDRRLENVTSNIVYASCFGLCTTNAECLTSVKDLAVNHFLYNIVGNPSTNGNLSILFNENIDSDKTLMITNNIGVNVSTLTLGNSDKEYHLDISNMQSGIYHLTVNTKDQTLTRKFIKL